MEAPTLSFFLLGGPAREWAPQVTQHMPSGAGIRGVALSQARCNVWEPEVGQNC